MIPYISDWNGGFNENLSTLRSNAIQIPPWGLKYDERRELSCEDRVIQQLRLEKEWDDTCVEGIWKALRAVALPSKDYRITEDQFIRFLQLSGISCLQFQRNTFNLFNEALHSEEGMLNALHFCKSIHMALSDPHTARLFTLHCYEIIAFPSELVTVDMLDSQIKRLEPKVSKKAQPSIFAQMKVLAKMMEIVEGRESKSIDFASFETLFLSRGSGAFVALFTKQIMECCAKYFKPSFGLFPIIPQRWTNTTEAIAYKTSGPADADSYLLQDLEAAGKEYAVPKKRRIRARPKRGS